MMPGYLYPTFLTDPRQYHEAEALWQRHWNDLIDHIGEATLWQSPWLGTTFADGTPMLDGNPIFSAVSPNRRLGVRVIQLEPADNPREIAVWAGKFAEHEPEEISELVIACVLTDETLLQAIDVMKQWITLGEVRLVRQFDRPSFPSSPREARPPCLELTPRAA